MAIGTCKCGKTVEYNDDGYGSPECDDCWKEYIRKEKEKEQLKKKEKP